MLMFKDVYRETARKMIRDEEAKICCIACGESDPNVIEIHHPLGRKISALAVPLCKNCHAKITAEQNKLPPKERGGVPLIEVSLGAFAKVWGECQIKQVHKGIKK